MAENSKNLGDSLETANHKNGSKEPGSHKKQCNKYFIEIQLVDENQKGIADENCLITLPDGGVYGRVTNSDGAIRLDGILSRWCSVKFPNLDKDI